MIIWFDLCTARHSCLLLVDYYCIFFWYCFSYFLFLYFVFMVIADSDDHSNTTCFRGYMNDLHFDPFNVSDSRFIANNEDLDPENNFWTNQSQIFNILTM